MIIEELRFSHLNDSQPEPGIDVMVSDGCGRHLLARLDHNDEDDKFIYEWYCEDNESAYSLDEYPFWASVPKLEFPDSDREIRVLLKEYDDDDVDKEEDYDVEAVNTGQYEIVGSEIRRK